MADEQDVGPGARPSAEEVRAAALDAGARVGEMPRDDRGAGFERARIVARRLARHQFADPRDESVLFCRRSRRERDHRLIILV
jgi:hypothetical protein